MSACSDVIIRLCYNIRIHSEFFTVCDNACVSLPCMPIVHAITNGNAHEKAWPKRPGLVPAANYPRADGELLRLNVFVDQVLQHFLAAGSDERFAIFQSVGFEVCEGGGSSFDLGSDAVVES